MMRSAALLFLLFPALALAQAVDPLTFRDRVHDFGQVVEANGPVSYDFAFTNTSPRPVTIVNVVASCGCTTPGWTKEPVAPGKTGIVKASFHPAGRPGYFNKTLTVVTDANAASLVLQLTGTVVGGTPAYVNEFPVTLGNMKLKSKSFAMGIVFANAAAAVKDFTVMNGGDVPLKFLGATAPDYIKVDFLPSSLEPGKLGLVQLTFDGTKRNTYGFISENIQLLTDDPKEPQKSITVFASLEDYYPPLTADDIKTAPLAMLAEQTIDAGQYPPGATLERSVALYNRGKKELKIKALVGNCSCITAVADKKALKAGDSTQIRIQFKPQTRGGTQQKAVNIYTNDPRTPVQTVSVSVFINN